jgi:hypothetical protein
VGEAGEVQRYANGRWSARSISDDVPTSLDLQAVWVSGPTDVWAVGSRGTVLHWDGQRWTTGAGFPVHHLLTVTGTGANEVWVGGNSGTLMHFDGTRWTSVDSGTTEHLLSVLPTAGALWTLSLEEFQTTYRVRHRTGSAWTSDEVREESWAALFGVGERVWALGALGVSEFQPGRTLLAQGTPFTAAWGLDPANVWLVGQSVVRFDGTTFTPQEGAGTDSWTSIWGSSDSDVWAAGKDGRLVHWDGARWTTVRTGTPGEENSLWGSGPSDVWAVSRYGRSLHWDGAAWTSVPVPQLLGGGLSAVWGSGPGDVWATGRTGTLLRYRRSDSKR